MQPSCSAPRTVTGAAPGAIPKGLELQDGRTALRLTFPRPINGPGMLRQVLKQLADRARAA